MEEDEDDEDAEDDEEEQEDQGDQGDKKKDDEWTHVGDDKLPNIGPNGETPVIIQNFVKTPAQPKRVADGSKIKRQEKENNGVPKYPNILQLPQYKTKIQQNLARASAHGDDKEMAWIAKVWKDGTTLHDLQVIPRK